MSDPNYMHEFWPNRKGTCQAIVSGKHCGLTEDTPVHKRFKIKQKEAAVEVLAEVYKLFPSLNTTKEK